MQPNFSYGHRILVGKMIGNGNSGISAPGDFGIANAIQGRKKNKNFKKLDFLVFFYMKFSQKMKMFNKNN